MDNEFGITDPFRMTVEELARKNAHVFASTGPYPGYQKSIVDTMRPLQTDYNFAMMQAQESAFKRVIDDLERDNNYLKQEVDTLVRLVAELESRLSYLENQKLLAL